jgi:hypothetical protein
VRVIIIIAHDRKPDPDHELGATVCDFEEPRTDCEDHGRNLQRAVAAPAGNGVRP